MATYKVLAHHGTPTPTIPKPEVPPLPVVLTVQDGLPVIYGTDTLPTCGIRVVHPTNPKAPSKFHSIAILYVPPHGQMELHSHEAEETYSVISGEGTLLTTAGNHTVRPGHHVFLPSWAAHGVENTGTEPLVFLLSTAPPNP
jgi:mannose-6-phosphate isomerase-like protein (cupin superfamily)